MNSYKFDSIVNRQEAEALKELIFKRARERAESIVKESQAEHVTSICNDVMGLARESFVANKNPFSISFESKTEAMEESIPETRIEEKEDNTVLDREIGFARRHASEIKLQITNRNKNSDNKITQAAKDEVMIAARNDFDNKASFTGALNFLNSQASISLVSKKGKSFEAFA